MIVYPGGGLCGDCVVEGVHGRGGGVGAFMAEGTCVAGGMHGKGCAWWGHACQRGMYGGGSCDVRQWGGAGGHAWQGGGSKKMSFFSIY